MTRNKTIKNKIDVGINPSDYNYKEYPNVLKSINSIYQTNVKKILTDYLPEDNSRYAIATTGSDGRLEKNLFSPLEIIIIYKDQPEEERDRILKNIFHIINDNKEHFFEEYEYKPLDKNDEIFSYFLNIPKKVYPGRILDARLLIGCNNVFNEYKNKLYFELINRDIGKRIKKKTYDRLRSNRKVLRTGEDKFGHHIHYENGLLLYEPITKIFSTKYPLLRPVQYKLTYEILKAIRNNKIDNNTLRDLKQNTIDKISYLYYGGFLKLNSREIEDIKDAYSYSLYYYHLSEENYKLYNSIVTEIDVYELNEAKNIIEDFSKRNTIFK